MHDRNGDMPAPATDQPDEPDEQAAANDDPAVHFPQEVLSDEMPKGEMG